MYYLFNGECVEIMDYLIKKGITVDFILTDPPYGTTECKWDSVIEFNQMWDKVNKLIKDNGAVALFGSEPFSTNLRISNIKCYKYDWIWLKNNTTGFQHCKNMPLKKTENISVFSKAPIGHKSLLGDRRMIYNPVGVIEGKEKVITENKLTEQIGKRKNQIGKKYKSSKNLPNNVLEFNKSKSSYHPTQKPTELLEYLIKTYTNEGDTVLDFTMGSGSTGVACLNTDRNFIGIELDDKYYDIAVNRLSEVK